MSHRDEVTSKHPQGANYRFVTATDSNPIYLGFIEPWIEHHKKLYPQSDVVVILVNDTIPYYLENYKKYIKLWQPVSNLSTAYQAQMLRILYPVLLDEKQNILCDIDLFLLNDNLLNMFDNIGNHDTRCLNFGCLSKVECMNSKQLPFCYTILSKNLIKEKCNISTEEDIKNLLEEEYIKDDSSRGYCWFIDQLFLYKKFIDYSHFVKIDRYGGDRVDRDWFNPNCPNIRNAIYNKKIVDFHAPRPYEKYKSFIHATLDSCFSAPQ